MSAYIVEPKTINRVVSYCVIDRDLCEWIKFYHHYDLDTEEGKNKFANDLYKMNVEAVNQRYNEINTIKPIKFEFTPVNQFQALKSMHCLRYQCEEGDVPETELFKVLDSIIHFVEHRIISSLPQYEIAEWE